MKNAAPVDAGAAQFREESTHFGRSSQANP